MSLPPTAAATRTFSLHDLLAFCRDGERACPAQPSQPGVGQHVFSTVTMSSLPHGNPPMEPGGLFVAIRGAVRDGHAFVADAIASGARAALVRAVPENLEDAVRRGAVVVWEAAHPVTPQVSSSPVLVVVDDPLTTLQRCAAWWRRRHRARVVAVTGSVGKTTTKDLIAGILEARGAVLRTRGNFNNELGLPFTLLALTREHDFAVLEIGISAPGEMDVFAGIAQPDSAVVTRVAPAHLERFGDIDTVEREKGRLIEHVDARGAAIVNADDERVYRMRTRTRARVITYGTSGTEDVSAEEIEDRGLLGLRFVLSYRGERRTAHLPLVGRHFITCALAAAAAAFAEGCTWHDVLTGLSRPPPGRRLQPICLPSGVTLLDDTYNASPAAIKAALDVLSRCNGRRIAVLGDMFELGAAGPAAHHDVGTYAHGRADLVVAVGELARTIAAGARETGFSADRVAECATNAAAVEWLTPRLSAGDFVLIKGSRGMCMDEIVRALAGEAAPEAHGGH